MAVENERGNPANPLKIAWLEGATPNVHDDKKDTLDSSSKNIDTTTTTKVCDHVNCFLTEYKFWNMKYYSVFRERWFADQAAGEIINVMGIGLFRAFIT